MKKKIIRMAFKESIPIFAGYIVLGIGFGILLVRHGFAFWWAPIMGATMLSGTLQYAAVNILSSGASLISIAVTSLIVNARHFLYGITMCGPYKKAGAKKPFLMLSLTDETYSIVSRNDYEFGSEKEQTNFCFFLSFFNYCYWVIGCTLGAAAGTLIPVDFSGVEFIITALFVCVLTEQWMTTKEPFPPLCGLVSSLVCLFVFGSENFLIPSMIIICLALSIYGKKKEAKEK